MAQRGRPKGSKNKPKPTIDGVLYSKIKKMRNLKGTWNFFSCDTREAFIAAKITDGQMAAYISGSMEDNAAIRKEKMEEATEAVEKFEATYDESLEDIDANVQGFRQQIEDKVKWYLKDFEVPIGPDEDNLKNMASAQLRLDQINDVRLHQMAKPVRMQTTKAARDIFSSLADEEKGLLGQVRLLQGAMGVDRPTRDRRASESTGVDRVQAIVQQAKEFLKDEVVEIKHCGIRIAWTWMGFPEEGVLIRTKCPRCGEVVEYEEKPQDTV